MSSTGRGRRVARISDVARLAGVSVGTASKALNGRAGASEATRARVRAAAAELGFRPNALARGLPSGRSFTVGLITTDSFGRFTIPIMLGAEDALGDGDMAVLLCDTRDEPAREVRYVEMLAARAVDGIIVTGRRTEPRPPLPEPSCPVVYAFTPSQDPRDCSVVVDERAGTEAAVEHLLSLGRRRLCVITGPRRHRSARVRASAAAAAARRAGAPLAAPPAFGAWEEAWGRRAVVQLLQTVPDLDGIVCGSDQIARGVTDELDRRGRDVPREIAVVGFDNWEVMTESSRPPLTTVDMQLDDVGRAAARLLLTAIDGSPRPGTHAQPCRLVVRGSSGG